MFSRWTEREQEDGSTSLQADSAPNRMAAGKEVVLRYDTSLESGNAFSTDANGREMQVPLAWIHHTKQQFEPSELCERLLGRDRNIPWSVLGAT